jgi:biotin operon repressor
MVRWERWRRMLEDGTYSSRAELARGEGVSRAAVTIGLRKLEEAACSAGRGG